MATPRRDDSMSSLLPSFRHAVEVLCARMRARGYDPLVWETGRSAAREAALDSKGAGSSGVSMHRYGAAVDIVSKSRMWDWPEFYVELCEQAERLGLTSGHRWKRVDSTHVQALPASQQALFRKLKPEQRDAFVKVFFKDLESTEIEPPKEVQAVAHFKLLEALVASGKADKEVIRDFQREAGLATDGIIGPKTRAALLAKFVPG
jgi:hypothetical protein